MPETAEAPPAPAIREVSALAYRLLDGTVSLNFLPVDGIPLPGLAPDVEPCTMHSGQQHVSIEASVPVVAEIARTMTPGVTWHLSPRGTGQATHFGGLCWRGDGSAAIPPTIWLGTWCHARNLVHLAYHEAQHAVDDLLTDDEVDILDTACLRGEGYRDEYGDSLSERRAELVATLGAYVHGGGRLVPHPATPEIAVIGRILSGEVGRRRLVPVPEPVRQQSVLVRDPMWIRGLRGLGLAGVADWLTVPA